MTEATPNPTPLERRRLLRTGVVMAGVAAGAVAATAGLATNADATTGDTLILGTPNTADQTTSVAKGGLASNGATLGLSNTTGGPTLFLEPDIESWDGDLAPGEIINSNLGPFIGTYDESTQSPMTDYLVTGTDLSYQPVFYSVDPTRLLDTRSDQSNVLGGSSATPFDLSGRLTAGQWIDVAVEPADEGYYVDSAFFNLTATGGLSGGNMTAYPPGDRPSTSTLNFQKALSLANGTFVALGFVDNSFAVRIYTTATVHVILDYTGANVSWFPMGPEGTPGVEKQQSATRRRRSPRNLKSILGRQTR